MVRHGVNPYAREGDIRALMLAAGVEVASGPSAVGLYDLSCTPGIAVDEAFAQLAAATDIIESVSRIDE
ncbi:hypothetical protein D9R08_10380 [Rhodophyticola porphyridii]|uniref:Uncharacterized protein n=1 Tax=Rhodophyticola porphyridii TaxID=1852017 RepID=A0A3L9Y8T4_9RHOB|nr:hypothetical protein D9R08_10380 [Rhodophyticola porphyridii]